MTPNEIVAKLKAASAQYYNTGKSTMSDAEFDVLVEQLRETDPENEYLAEVGAPPSGLFKPVKHSIPMGSLEKVKNRTELEKWYAKLPKKMVLVMWKYDGASISLRYEKGKLVQAVTRGDGATGEDVTQNILKSQHIPKKLRKPFTGFVRGEVILTKQDFEKFFKPEGGSNPRNCGNGCMRAKDGDKCEHLRVLPFDASFDDLEKEFELQKVVMLAELGFSVDKFLQCASVDDIQFAYEQMMKERDSLPFEVDGIVIKLDDVFLAAEMGESDDRPKAHRAYKFPPLGAETVLEDIIWATGHTGTVVPTGKVRPVEIGGVTVSSVLLNNLDEFERLNLQSIGCRVHVIRAGDVIPKVVAVLKQGVRPLNTPTKCPSCSTKLVRQGPALMCSNQSCEGRLLRKIRRWLTALDIKFIGDEIERALWESGLVKDPADLYTLNERSVALAQLRVGNGELGASRATQIIDEIAKTRDLPLHKFMGALGIRFLGTRAAKHMVEDNGLDTLTRWMRPDVIRTTMSLGPTIREEVAAGVEQSLPLIKKLLAAGINVTVEAPPAEVKDTGKSACGLSFCFTGALSMPRSQAQGLVRQAGGTVKEEVSKGLDILVIADPDSTSSKAQKARKFGTKLISEEAFQRMV